jgi:predicted dinucleotide-binding enzyme
MRIGILGTGMVGQTLGARFIETQLVRPSDVSRGDQA